MHTPDETAYTQPTTDMDFYELDLQIGYARAAYYSGDLRGTVSRLVQVCDKWGHEGEYHIALSSAFAVSQLASPLHRDPTGLPLIEGAVDLTTARLGALARILLQQTGPLASYTPQDQDLHAALTTNAPLVQRYVHQIHRTEGDAAYDTWRHIYAFANPDNTRPTQEEAWRAAACSALLLWWSTLYTVIPTEN